MNNRSSILSNRSFAVGWAIGVVCLSGCQTLTPPQAKQEAETRWSGVRSKVKLQLAQQHFERHLFSEALAAATESISLDPTDANAYALAAKSNLELGQAASAGRLLDAAQGANVTSPELHYLNGVVHELRGDLAGAVESYRAVREQDRTQVDYLLAEAECLAAMGQRRPAVELLTANYHEYDARGAVAVLAAHIAELEGSITEAIKWYREALGFLPQNVTISEGLGVLLAQTGECAEAVPLLRPLAEPATSVTQNGSIRRAIATCYLKGDDPASAQAVLLDYARATADDGAAQLLLAQASLALDDLLTAAEAVHRLEQTSPNERDVLLGRALLDWKRGRLSDAAATLERLIAADPSDADSSCWLGEILATMGDEEEASVAFERALFAEPGNAWAKARLARLSR